ncbi:MAG TPA: histidine phosphatase family protein [Caulifigura sp.]|nr:histidine phosphatase family protein [Caulifigura sp.]
MAASTFYRTLLLMRHAKSSWDNPAWTDHDRPLNDRGDRDAPRMAEALKERGLTPTHIVSSTAMRAKTTAEIVAESIGFSGEIVLEPRLYLATTTDWHFVVKQFPEAHETILCVGHNPGLEQLLRKWSGEEIEMPTAAIAIVDVTATPWGDFDRQVLTVTDVLRPKEL